MSTPPRRHRLRSRFLRCAVALAGSAACGGEPTAPASSAVALPIPEDPLRAGRSALRVAVVRPWADPLLVEVPARARAGVPIDVAVTTYSGGCVRDDTTVVVPGDRGATVVPYQRVSGSPVCTQELLIRRRIVPVVLHAVGDARVVVIGRDTRGDSLVRVARAVRVE